AWSLLRQLRMDLVNTTIQGAEGTYGVFAVVIGLLFWFFVLGQITMLCMEINVVTTQQLWPRSLGTLSGMATTDADVRAHTCYITRGQRARNLTVLTRVGSTSATFAAATADDTLTPCLDKSVDRPGGTGPVESLMEHTVSVSTSYRRWVADGAALPQRGGVERSHVQHHASPGSA